MSCAIHPDRESAAVCKGCQRGYCDACTQADPVLRFYLEAGGAELYCQGCGFQDATASVAQVQQERDARQALARQRRQAGGRLRRARPWVLFVLLLALAGGSLWLNLDREPITGVYGLGAGLSQDPALQNCLADLWQLSAALVRHTKQHGQAPASLDALLGAELESVPRPAKGRYLYDADGPRWHLSCDQPQAYGAAAIFCSSRTPVPVVLPSRAAVD